MLTYTPKYGMLDYLSNNNNVLKGGHFLEHRAYVNSPAAWSTVDIDENVTWFIYKHTTENGNSISWAWIDNWGNIWEIAFNNHNIPPREIRKVLSGFEKPMPDACIENIISAKWPLRGVGYSVVHTQLKAYVTMFLEIDSLKSTIKLLETTHEYEMDEACDEIANLDWALEKANDELAILKFVEPAKLIPELLEFKETVNAENELLMFFTPG